MAVLLKSSGNIEIILPKGNEFTLEELQKCVGGYIELVHNIARELRGYGTFDFMFINEEGKLLNLPLNIMATAIYEDGDVDPICGDAVLCNRSEVS